MVDIIICRYQSCQVWISNRIASLSRKDILPFEIREDIIVFEMLKDHEPYPPDLGQLDQRHVRQRRVHLPGVEYSIPKPYNLNHEP